MTLIDHDVAHAILKSMDARVRDMTTLSITDGWVKSARMTPAGRLVRYAPARKGVGGRVEYYIT